MKYDRHAVVSCDNCDAVEYEINYSEEAGVPETCPFCGEELEDVQVIEKDDFEKLADYMEEIGSYADE